MTGPDRAGARVGVRPRPPLVPAQRLPPDLVAQVEVHRRLAAELASPPRFAVPAPRAAEPRSAPRGPSRRSRLLTLEVPALLGAVLIAVTGTLVSLGAPTTTAPAPPQARQVGCVQDASASGCLVPVPAAQVGGLYVDPGTPAAQQVADWTAEGRTADAEAVGAIAERAVPLWLAGGDATARVTDYVSRAASAGAVPLFVAYNIPDRDCGSFSGGGAAGADDYRAWVASVAAGLGGSDAIVVLEPDAIAHQLTGCADDGGERYGLLAGAVDALTAAGARVYIDAGNPGFTGDATATAEALRRAGIDRAAGFSVNVANFYTTEDSVAYGTAVSTALGGGVRFVVDTSRNGAGRAPEPTDGSPEWCNPPDRLLGTAPTLDSGIPLVDGLLWIKRPGESDGACRPGEPEAGQWYPDYALDLVTD
ncbi:glycoside hydrolase family 6 protein [Pseudonocardia oceani]|uniref:glycoside hydrolase family 6 protein n=4 Tax=Pseudonocardia oceani TaxID=2792013 RepID=UPI001C4A0C99|nr:glycoside hydrolase family 6 protein [Pseudonocardia oceani]